MSLKVAVQMDHISSINIAGDSAFALMLEAQTRGHALYHYTPDRLAMTGDTVTAGLEPVEVRDAKGEHFVLGERKMVDLSEMDVILMRQDPPFDMAYVAATHMLEKIHPKTLVVNDPASVRNAPEKLFVTEFADLMPETLITRDRETIDAFRAEHGDIVMKPLFGHGGAAVFRVTNDDLNYGSLYDFFAASFREPWVIQKFLPNVSEGDKRILLVDGQFAGAVNRVPQAGDLRSNMVRGGAAREADLTPREREICARLGPALRERGLILVGIDVIDGHLTEINVTAPTGIRAVARLGGPDIAALFWDTVEAKRAG
ncbi:glutathione synthase [Stappia taiwanensis]|uniref:Glutathione synthetase n=1 Tax=Stappia taiwanensis TaxID=992267 RepID=A0A838XKG9_9HYPH|nr:glutathione synthase [Stappia taiwanensis]MBA4611829.1 glutathione synthase [Stappia taiwanensis]GGF03129.1 glutathione synthetase [Stappia taiwanensis]